MTHSAANGPQLRLLKRRTRRATVSLPEGVLEQLQAMADQEGRSLSNVMAFLLEYRLRDVQLFGDTSTTSNR